MWACPTVVRCSIGNQWLSNLTTCLASQKEMSDARLPLAYRDSCAHLLIPLNRCRRDEYYLPWKCEVRFVPATTALISRQIPRQLTNLSHFTRPSAIHTKNANTMNSKSEWLRWMNYGRPGEENEATRCLTSRFSGSYMQTSGRSISNIHGCAAGTELM